MIPAYKPEKRMLDVISGLSGYGFGIVVVDDGSGKEYRELFNEASKSSVLLRHEVNKGKGEALKTGIAYIDGHFEKPYVIVTADADGQHRIEDIVKVSRISRDNPDALVLGKRTLYKSSPILSRIGNGATRLFYHLATGRYIYETQTGLRGFGDELVGDYLRIPGKRYEYESDMMLISSDRNIIEVDIQTVYFDNNSGSHFDPVIDTARLHREYIRYKLPSIVSGIADYLFFILGMLVFSGWALMAQLCARVLSFGLKAILHKAVFFSERIKPIRYIVTCAVILAVETGMVVGLGALGMSPYIAKLIAGSGMIFLSIGIRKLFVKLGK